jgi:hypothetical protein
MKSIFYCFSLCVGLCFITSCSNRDFLDETQTTDLDEKTVFADSTYTAGFLTQAYVDLGFDTEPNRFSPGGLQCACDEAEFKMSSSNTTNVMFATGTINPVTVSSDAWETCYQNIRRVNVFLKHIDGCPMAENTKTVYKAEARFLRAWYYSVLLKHYGGVPLIGDSIYDTSSAIKTTRDKYADCVEYIVSECETAAKDLPTLRTGRDNGRIGDGICKALISEVRLFAASPLFNGSDFAPADFDKELLGYPTYDKERWKTAVDAARAVITLNAYQLYERHYDGDGKAEPGWGYYAQFKPKDFYKYTDGPNGITYDYGAYCGIILEKKRGDGLLAEQTFDPPSCGGSNPGGYAYSEMAEAYPMLDGKAINQSTKYPYNPLKPTVGRDPRFNNSIISNGSICAGGGDFSHVVYTEKGTGSTSDAIYVGTPTGYFIRKSIHRQGAANYWIGPPQSRSLIRYAEILLNYAEAVNEYYGPDYTETLGGKEISPYTILKAIRSRAGIEAGDDGMYGLKAGMSQDEMREAIRLERKIELAFEGKRFFDVRRWMIADQTESQTMHGLEITKSNSGTETSRIIAVRTHVFRKAMYFWPIPYQETVKSKSLIQNPYYN